MNKEKVDLSLVLFLILGAVFVIGVLFFISGLASVKAGHVGVVSTFGRVHENTLDPGLHWTAPWNKVTRMSIQTIEDKETASVPTSEGLLVDLECSLLYSLKKEKATEIYATVGENYAEVVVTPQFRSALRGAVVNHKAQDLYSSSRKVLESELMEVVNEMLDHRGVRCEGVLLRSLQLPQEVSNSINAKLAADQDAQKMQFIIAKETQEAERKRVEAKGIADAQDIIHKTLTPEYLRYLWIQSLEKAAEHADTIVYVPTGNDGMPIFREANTNDR